MVKEASLHFLQKIETNKNIAVVIKTYATVFNHTTVYGTLISQLLRRQAVVEIGINFIKMAPKM